MIIALTKDSGAHVVRGKDINQYTISQRCAIPFPPQRRYRAVCRLYYQSVHAGKPWRKLVRYISVFSLQLMRYLRVWDAVVKRKKIRSSGHTHRRSKVGARMHSYDRAIRATTGFWVERFLYDFHIAGRNRGVCFTCFFPFYTTQSLDRYSCIIHKLRALYFEFYSIFDVENMNLSRIGDSCPTTKVKSNISIHTIQMMNYFLSWCLWVMPEPYPPPPPPPLISAQKDLMSYISSRA